MIFCMRESRFLPKTTTSTDLEKKKHEQNYLYTLSLSIVSDVEKALSMPFNLLDVEIATPEGVQIHPKNILPEGSIVTLYKRVEADFSWDSVQVRRSGIGRSDWEVVAVGGECSISDQRKIVGAFQRLRF